MINARKGILNRSKCARKRILLILDQMGKGGRAMGVGDYVVSLRRRDRLFVLSFHSFHSKLVNHDSSLCP